MKSLHDFLEEDILNFLDSRMSVTKTFKPIIRDDESALFGDVDYETEVDIALNDDDLSKAKTIYKKVKSIYGKLARKSPRRASLDLVIKNILNKIKDYELKNGINDTEEQETEEESFKQTLKTASMHIQNANIDQMSGGSRGGGFILPFMNAPLDFEDLDKEQKRERYLLQFKQQLEKESEKVYLEMKRKQEEEQEKHFKVLRDKVLEENKKQFEELSNSLSKKFSNISNSQNDVDLNKLKQELEEKQKKLEEELTGVNKNSYSKTEKIQKEQQIKNIEELRKQILYENKQLFTNLTQILSKKLANLDSNPEYKENLNKGLNPSQVEDLIDKEIQNILKEKNDEKFKNLKEIKEFSEPIPTDISKIPELKKINLISQGDSFIIYEIDKQMPILKSSLKNKDYLKARKVFNIIKELTKKIKKSEQQKKSIIKTLKQVADYMSKIAKKIEFEEKTNYFNNEVKDVPEKKHKINKNPLSKEYFDAIYAIKNGDKLSALKLLVPLAKKHPLDNSIKIRLKEALEL